MNIQELANLSKLIRYYVLTSTTTAGSGHPSSSLSAVELMATLFFGKFFRYDFQNPHYILNDRIIFSKGHAAPLLYSLYAAAGVISEKELLTLRKFDSVLEGHPTPRFKYIDVATGSLGQGLSMGLGMALGIKMQIKQQKIDIKREPKVFVLLGDSEMAEGQIWEAMEVASHYKLNNLVGMIDVNRLGQRGETMLGWDVETYKKRAESFGWKAVVIEDGRDLDAIDYAFSSAIESTDKPVMIIAKTKKGAGVSALENLDNWHGKPLPPDKLEGALKELGEVDKTLRGKIEQPEKIKTEKVQNNYSTPQPIYKIGDSIPTREAYGDALAALTPLASNIVALDAETSNSTYAEKVKKTAPEQFLEMYIAEQNMVSVALGMSKVGYVPFASSFAAFLSRAFDQIRMAQYSEGNVKIAGSHAGVSIGVDGSSQMALEDLSMMRSILHNTVLYPSDAISTFKLVELMAKEAGMFYMRTTREKTSVIYTSDENFSVGGSKTIKSSTKDVATVFAAGITLHEALKAYSILHTEGINIAVVDLYSVKPIDKKTINAQAEKTKHIIVVEDHYPAGGIGEAVKYALNDTDAKFHHLAVTKIPRSGTPAELLAYEEIDAQAIVKLVKKITHQ